MDTKKVGLLIVVLLLSLAGAAVAGSAGTEAAAEPVTDRLLTGLNENNYRKFSSDFDRGMKENFSEANFRTLHADIKAKIGDYISREFVGMEEKDGYKILIYHAVFSKETQKVVVRTVVSELNGQFCVSGFWLDSPNLRK